MARRRTEEARAAGRRIAALRRRRKLSQQAAAELLGVGYRTYQYWEAGQSLPHARSRKRLAEFFGVPAHDLFPEHTPPSSPEDGRLERIETEVMRQGKILDALKEAALIRGHQPCGGR